jgi:hypothetical protein
MAQPAVRKNRPIDDLCDAWVRATDADEAGKCADELAQRILDVRDPRLVTRLCSAIFARLSRNDAEDADADDEVIAVLDAVMCGPLDTPGARGDTFRRAAFAAVEAQGIEAIVRGFGRKYCRVREMCCKFLLACARRDAERAGPAVRAVAETVAATGAESSLYYGSPAGKAVQGIRALVAAFGNAAPRLQREYRVAEGLGALLGGAFFERDWETRCVWRRANGTGGSRSCFGGDDAAPPAKRARRSPTSGLDISANGVGERSGLGFEPSLEDVERLCDGLVYSADSDNSATTIDRARGRGDAPAEDFALELLDDNRPPLDGVDFYRTGALNGYIPSKVVLNADARWGVCAACRDAIQKTLRVACSVNLYATPLYETTLDPHADDHCVFVAQLSGAKRWRIFLDGKQFPDLGTTIPLPPGDDVPFFEVTLWPGDVLYVPRGAPHVCRAISEEPSVHVSIGIDLDPKLTWRGAVEAYTGDSVAHLGPFVPALRRACLPALLAGDQDDAFAAGLAAARALAARPPVGAEGLAAIAAEDLHPGPAFAALRRFAGAAFEQSVAVTALLRARADVL